jgi:hypothetical protein
MATPSILIVPDRYKSGVLYSQLPENGAVDFGVTRATPAFRTNASGVSESVASGVPRLDYPAAGGCPALLVEPAATNLALRSEPQDATGYTATNVTFLNNSTEFNPSFANVNAVELIDSSLNRSLLQAITVVSGTTYTLSFFVKVAGGILPNQGTGNYRDFTLTINSSDVLNYNQITYQNFGGGIYRAICTFVSNGGNQFVIRKYSGLNNNNAVKFTGLQLETGSVATSYIPTTTASVTRNADVISKTGVSGFIGQSVGTLYAEVDVRNFQADGRILAISNGTSDNRIALLKGANSTLRGLVTTASGSVADIATASGQTAGVYKIALAYAADDFVLYVNGSQIGTDTSGAVPACTDVYLGKIETSGTTNQLNDRIRAAAIYTTRLSNTDLAALTTL